MAKEMKKEETNEEENKPKQVDKGTFAFFMIMFPSLLIAGISMLAPNLWWVNIALLIYQSLILKQFIDNYYGW